MDVCNRDIGISDLVYVSTPNRPNLYFISCACTMPGTHFDFPLSFPAIILWPMEKYRVTELPLAKDWFIWRLLNWMLRSSRVLNLLPKNNWDGGSPVVEWGVFGKTDRPDDCQPKVQEFRFGFALYRIFETSHTTSCQSVGGRMVRGWSDEFDSVSLKELLKLFWCELRPVIAYKLGWYSIPGKQFLNGFKGLLWGYSTHSVYL